MSRIAPKHLPQVNAPFNYTLNMLDKEGVDYKYMQADPEELDPSQAIVFQDKISQIDMNNIRPIWISKDNMVLDGHHRLVLSLGKNIPIKCIKIMLSQKEAIRVLNKIQDIYEYENQENIMEVVAQTQINGMNDIDSAGTDGTTFLEAIKSELEDDDREILHNTKLSGKKTKKITGYRKKEVNEKSIAGNFFSLKPVDGYNKYEMEFDNILNTNDLDLSFKSDINPVSVLANNWFPNIDFDKISKNHNVTPDSLINRAVAEKAKQMNYDGIKYGDIMVQGLN